MSSGALNRIEHHQAWNVVTIAGVDSPGWALVPKAPRKYKYDVKEGKGTKGASVTFTNQPPAEFSITFYLWLPTHWVQWDLFRPLLKYDPTKKNMQAYDIYYPSLADVDITSVVTTDIGSVTPVGDPKDGYDSIEVSYLEYLPASKTSAVSSPSGSKAAPPGWTEAGKTPGNQPDPAIEAAQKEAAALAKQAQEAGI